MAYFKYFPKTAYDVRGIDGNLRFDYVTNLLTRVLVKSHGWKDVDGSPNEALVGASHYQKYLSNYYLHHRYSLRCIILRYLGSRN